ncbi:hypothetical protein ACS5PK_04660 [Roseateles sp. DB2]|uniref:hypothetical protein n=1 Tax=Roseateles sp. DB2 TaxID=3453717 RepID=UPI003EE8FE71
MPRNIPVITALTPLFGALLGSLLVAPAAAAEPLLVPIDARIGTEARGRERGEQAARADIAAGMLKLFESTGPETVRASSRRSVRKQLLRAKGIRLALGPGCTDPGEQRGYVAAYNERMSAEARRRFGPDFWEQLDRDVDQQLRAGSRRVGGTEDRPAEVLR